ncbi:hypothetical protein C0Q70_06439 [Pomacea canaliculata]|uniref:Uncharacterized protein n=1 Tax=Pomacea canaliculata TaxID=400727 RepID=A0A2T7PP18_POMCA|nr:hypothetical protein C0Q70_06439 [Pomacea canaliculata]
MVEEVNVAESKQLRSGLQPVKKGGKFGSCKNDGLYGEERTTPTQDPRSSPARGPNDNTRQGDAVQRHVTIAPRVFTSDGHGSPLGLAAAGVQSTWSVERQRGNGGDTRKMAVSQFSQVVKNTRL